MVIKVEAAMNVALMDIIFECSRKSLCDGHEFAGESTSMGKNANKEIYSFGGGTEGGRSCCCISAYYMWSLQGLSDLWERNMWSV